ncbi:MAG: flagellar biosynthesis protein FlhB [Candidatus Neomarinimicrobiota bacterium]|nr:MAG: flagellar biosynthesis protein FlhB [Candidatus Neomarinimicrobiota bacterium]
MAEKPLQDRTEKATSRRRERAREEGNVARSQDLNSVTVLFAGVIALRFLMPQLASKITGFIRYVYGNFTAVSITPGSLQVQSLAVVQYFIPILALILLIIMFSGLGINIVQTGFILSAKALTPKLEKLNPLEGVKQLFSLRSVVELIKGVLKMVIVGIYGFVIIKKHLVEFLVLSNTTIAGIVTFIAGVMFEIFVKIGFLMIILGIADYFYQRWNYEKNLKMTKQEVKDEMKEQENPEIKGRIKSAQRQLARRRMMAAVPTATVVVTNPTHIAVALKYEFKNKTDAPEVVAKGQRKVAERIKEIARENGVPVIENKPLARTLFESLEIGMQIPAVFYQAVAEILAQVYKMKRGLDSAGAQV